MNAEKLTQKSAEAIRLAQTLAQEYGNPQIEQVHLLAALMADIIDNKKEGFIVASRVALTCGLRDTFNVTEDFRYRNLYMRGLIPDFNAKAFGW